MTKLIAIGEVSIATGIIAIASIAVIGACIVLYPLRLLVEWERMAKKPPGNPNRKDPFHP